MSPYFLLLSLHFLFTSATFDPKTNILLNSGSSNSVNVDNRQFKSDTSFFSPSAATSTLTDPNPSSEIYRTVRIFSTPSSYRLPISQSGPHVLRLHFSRFSNNQLSVPFNVSVSDLQLLTSFLPPNPQNSSSVSVVVIKEFVVPMNSTGPLVLDFSSSSFVNAVELFSAPKGLVPDIATLVGPSGTLRLGNVSSNVFETLVRLNVGGRKVTPSIDTLWRTWEPDKEGSLETNLGQTKEQIFTGNLQYSSDGPTEEVAPMSVYGTVREMNLSGNGDVEFNLSWGLQLNTTGRFMVRFHYCDIVSKALNQLYLNSYVNGYVASKDLDLSTKKLQLSTPYYEDFLVDFNGLGKLQVSVGPSSSTNGTKNAILNGLEVMKIKGVVVFSDTNQHPNRNLGRYVGIGVGCLCFVAIVSGLVVFFMCRKRKKRDQARPTSTEDSVWTPLSTYISGSTVGAMGTPLPNLNLELKIPFADISLATNNFDSNCQIGSGGFGKVYKGILKDGTKIAAKRGKRTRGSTSGQGLAEFYNEIMVLSRIRHRHLVSLIGYCEEQSEMILVYEYMEKGTLKDHLYSSDKPCLSWKQRLEICIGSAKGLHYLHTGSSSQGIIHRDVKSANILLNENYLAKVADFGLSKLGPILNQTHVSTNVKGSFGYLDPEYFKTQQLTDKSDVYSFGVVLLEALCARAAIDQSLPWEQQNLAEWGMKCIKKGHLDQIVDPQLKDSINANSVRKFGETVEKCLEQYGSDRPTMGDVLWNLEYTLKLEESQGNPDACDDSVLTISSGNATVASTYPSIPTTESVMEMDTISQIYREADVSPSQVFSQLNVGQGR